MAHADEKWREDALCREVGTDLFFPDKGEAWSTAMDAKRICKLCPVQQQCLQWALNHPGCHGIWGGTTEMERRCVNRRRRWVS